MSRKPHTYKINQHNNKINIYILIIICIVNTKTNTMYMDESTPVMRLYKQNKQIITSKLLSLYIIYNKV